MRSTSAALLFALASCGPVLAGPPDVLSLAGTWAFRLDPNGEGLDQNWQAAAFTESVQLPGSLDENGKGTPNAGADRAYLSRYYTYVGAAWYQRDVEVPENWAGNSLELSLERCHWETRLWVDGRPVGVEDSLCTPHVYSLGALSPGTHRLTLRVDNSVKYRVGLRAHSITEHTQTNWNGVVGRIELRPVAAVNIASVQVYPNAAKRTASIAVRVNNAHQHSAQCAIRASALGARADASVAVPAGGSALATLELALGADAPLWDEFSPRLIDAEIALRLEHDGTYRTETRRVRFGLRDIGRDGTQLTLNGRPYFVRGNLECCIFPLTGYPATDVPAWRRMMETARQYGLNHIRFHSWCPPEAAFDAADDAGITFHIETPVWTDLGKDPALDQYIRDEASRILEIYGNHPSFAMLAVGNEPSGPNKNAFLTDIVTAWKQRDARRLYTTCAGWPELPVSDYHVVHERDKKPYRLHRGPLGPSTDVDYRDVLDGCSAPAIAHELGQWCVYPDYREVPLYTGTLRARNLEGFRDSLRQSGMLDRAPEFAAASGRLQRLMYKADIETVLRTPGAGGFQLLSLQDFSGQGSALVGLLDAFWNAKPGVSAGEFRMYCSETVPLLRLTKRVWTGNETMTARAEISHFGPAPIVRAHPAWSARTADGQEIAAGRWEDRDIALGNGIPLGDLSFPLDRVAAPAKITVSVFLAGTASINAWDIWVYPANTAGTDLHNDVLITNDWTREAANALRRGRSVLLLPTQIAPSHEVKSAFEPIFWNTQWFPGQDRQLGVLCDPNHAAFAAFPNDGCTDWQWWELLDRSRVLLMDGLDPALRPLVQIIDDWNKNRRLGAVIEARAGHGRLMVCTLDIEHDLDQRPAAAALRRSLLAYMDSPAFAPQYEIAESWLDRAFAPAAPTRDR